MTEEERRGIINQQQRSRKRKRGKRHRRKQQVAGDSPPPSLEQTLNANTKNRSSPAAAVVKCNSKARIASSSFLDKMKAKLSGGHFRMINEKLYTCTGQEAFNYFKEDPALFNMYHAGYQEQMSHWPEQPVNVITKWLKDHSPSLIVADFGCGDACLARNVKNKVFSLDLISKDSSVIACDMSNVGFVQNPKSGSVFCLSLMGTNYSSFILEAHRVLKPRGWLLIAEVKSRFDPSTGGADPNKFSKAICQLGFTALSKDFSNKMFILLYFKKKEDEKLNVNEIRWPGLKPCLYKRR
nr:ribosomal RNA-processing protein 8 isoform X2 [Coffea arabica]